MTLYHVTLTLKQWRQAWTVADANSRDVINTHVSSGQFTIALPFTVLESIANQCSELCEPIARQVAEADFC